MENHTISWQAGRLSDMTSSWLEIWRVAAFSLFLAPLCFLVLGIVRRRISPLQALLRLSVLAILWKAVVEPIISDTPRLAPVLILADYSSSLSTTEREQLKERALTLLGDKPYKIIKFAEGTANDGEAINGSRTNIEAALRAAWGEEPSAILLLSDGNETIGSAERAIPSLAALNSPLYSLAPERSSAQAELKVVQVAAPLVAPIGRSVGISSTINNPTSLSVPATIEVYQGEKKLREEKILLPPLQDSRVYVESDPSLEGLNLVRTVLSWKLPNGESAQHENRSYIAGEKREKILLLTGSNEDDRFLSKALSSEAYQVTNLISSPSLSIELQGYSAIILNNVPLSLLPVGFSSAVLQFVESGGGLCMLGGNRSFGLGGYIGSPIADLLPVELEAPQAEKKRLDLAVELVLDKSQSMGNGDKIEFAKEAARQVIKHLKPEDWIGIIGFDQFPWVAVPIGQVAKVREFALKQIGDLYPTRRTEMYSAIVEAAKELQAVKAGRKHAILLTDGKISDAGAFYETLIREMRMSGITVSSVLLGDPADGHFLKRLSDIGGGAYYQTEDPRSLPKIFMADVTVMGGERTLKESREFLVRAGPDGISSTTLRTFPNLSGYVETKPRSGSRLELVVSGNNETRPLLASWKRGSGRALAFTSDTNGRWSAEWVPWPQFRTFWSEVINATRGVRNEKQRAPPFQLKPFIQNGDLVVDLFVYGELGALSPAAEIVTPSGKRSTTLFQSIEEGHFRALLNDAEPGTYRAKISAGEMQFPEVAWVFGEELFGEVPSAPVNCALLDKLSRVTGGSVNPTQEQFAVPEKNGDKEYLFPRNLALLGLALFLLEVALRIRRSR